jgi:hypothetical protein
MIRRSCSLIVVGGMMAACCCAASFSQERPADPAPPSSTGQPTPSGEPDYSSSLLTTQSRQPQDGPAEAEGAVTVPENTAIRVITDTPLSTRETREGAMLRFTVSEDVVVGHILVIPRGATVHATAVESKGTGALTGGPELVLKLTSLDIGGRTYPLYTYLFRVQGTSKTQPTERKIKDGVVIGAIVGGVFSGSARGGTSAVGRAVGMGTGAALGAGIGTAVAAATPGPILSIPAESQMDFSLALPIAVKPVSAQEAARLGQGLHHGGPALYVRGDTP